MESTLDNFIEEMNDTKEKMLQVRQEEADAKKRLCETDDSIREATLTRASSSADDFPKKNKFKQSIASTHSTAERELALLEMQARTDPGRVEVGEKRIDADMANDRDTS